MTDYYHDFEYGSDSNTAPYSPTNALKNLPGTNEATGNAVYNTNPGDRIFLARGSNWNIDSAWSFRIFDEGSKENPVIIDAYDRPGRIGDDKPKLSFWHTITSSDWTLSGTTGVWYISVGTFAIFRTFIDEVGQHEATSIATCNATDTWYHDDVTDRVYMYSGSDTLTPSDVYNKIWVPQSSSGVYLVRTSYIHVYNIHVEGTASDPFYIYNDLLSTWTGGFIIDNCKATYCGKAGITVSTSIDQQMLDYITLSNNHLDKNWHPNENDDAEHAGNGINLAGGGYPDIEVKVLR